MKEIYRALSILEALEFAALATVAAISWRRRRSVPGAWLAGTFATLGIVFVVAQFFPQGSPTPPDWFVKGLLVLIVAFPYLLFRFMQSFGGAARWLRVLAGVLTAALIVQGAALPRIPQPGQPSPLAVNVFVVVFAAQWVLLTGTVAIRLWRSGKGQSLLARKRMRTLSAGAAGLGLVVLVGVTNSNSGSTRPSLTTLVTSLIVLASGPLLLAGFAPPQALIRAWRGAEDEAREEAAIGLMAATEPAEVLERLLPHVASVVGAQATAFFDQAGSLLGTHGLPPGAARPDDAALTPVTLELPFGSLVLWANTYTPYFGPDDVELLRTLGVMASLALERCRLFARERAALEAMEEAQRMAHVGSWRVDLATRGAVWSNEQYRIYGLEPGSPQPTQEEARAMVHPEDRERSIHASDRALRDLEALDMQYRIVRPDGEIRYLHARGQLVRDRTGAAAEMIGTVQDVTLERSLQEESQAARDQALEASRLKSQFLANMSHEIRTPMSGILGVAQLLLMSEGDPVRRRRLRSLLEAGQNLLAIINDILDFSKVEAGKLELEVGDFDLLACLEGAISLLSSPAHDKGLALNLAVSHALPGWVRGDSLRLHQILVNIVGNAVKFTERGTVTLTAEPVAPGRLRFSIQDTGIGVAPEAQARLMEPFSQADASTTRRFGGTGLGLAICRQLIDLMGGTLHVSSEVDVGSTFWFELDLPAAAPQRLVPAALPGDVPGPDSLPAAGREGRILLADDAELNREVGAGLLEAAGYRVETVGDGLEAVEAARRGAYDVILMDCLMPLMDGYEATRRIREAEGPDRHAPIIALTAAAMSADRERCLAAGMDDYVSKPFDLATLVGAIARWVEPAEAVVLPVAAMDPPDLEPATPEPDAELMETLDHLRASIGAEAFEQVCRSFLTTTPPLLADLASAVRRGSAGSARALAHKLKGSMATFGASGLAGMADEVERTDPADLAGLEPLLARMGEEFARVAAHISVPALEA